MSSRASSRRSQRRNTVTPNLMGHTVVQDYTGSTPLGETRLKVYLRARPLESGNEPEKEMWSLDGGKISIKDAARHVTEHKFAFDHVFWTESAQENVFKQVCKPLVDHVMKGYNGCCFAYGQTGSGKTYSMFGTEGETRGIIPRAAEYLFRVLPRGSNVAVSFLEIYCDHIRDLGRAYIERSEKSKSGKAKATTSEWYLKKRQALMTQWKRPGGATPGSPVEHDLDIKEDFEGNVYVQGLSEIPVISESEIVEIVKTGFSLRATHGTSMNAESSRSHTVFTISVYGEGEGATLGKLNLVDLAGSERLKKSEAQGQRLKEMLSINSSLSALGNVARTLDPGVLESANGHIPYRDSKLTRVLQNSIGGNSHTSVIATIHPTRSNFEECLATMHFANRCRNVVNQPRVNYVNNDPRLLLGRIKKLRAEIRKLKYAIKAIVVQKNKQMALVMAELGVKGQVMGDGRVQLATGKVLGEALDMAAIEKEGERMAKVEEAQEAEGTESKTAGTEDKEKSSKGGVVAGITEGDEKDKFDFGSLNVENLSVRPTAAQLASPIALGSARSQELSVQAKVLNDRLRQEMALSASLRKSLESVEAKLVQAEKDALEERTNANERIKSLSDTVDSLNDKIAASNAMHDTVVGSLKQTQEKNLKAVYESTKAITERNDEMMARMPRAFNDQAAVLSEAHEKYIKEKEALEATMRKNLMRSRRPTTNV